MIITNVKYNGVWLSWESAKANWFTVNNCEKTISYNTGIFQNQAGNGVRTTRTTSGSLIYNFTWRIYKIWNIADWYNSLNNIIFRESDFTLSHKWYYSLYFTDPWGREVKTSARVFTPLEITQNEFWQLNFNFSLICDTDILLSAVDKTSSGTQWQYPVLGISEGIGSDTQWIDEQTWSIRGNAEMTFNDIEATYTTFTPIASTPFSDLTKTATTTYYGKGISEGVNFITATNNWNVRSPLLCFVQGSMTNCTIFNITNGTWFGINWTTTSYTYDNRRLETPELVVTDIGNNIFARKRGGGDVWLDPWINNIVVYSSDITETSTVDITYNDCYKW